MELMDKLKDWSCVIASCGILGEKRGGALIASLLAIPSLSVSRAVALFFPQAPYLLFIGFFIFFLVVVHLAVCSLPEEHLSRIVLDDAFSMMIALWGISLQPVNWKVVLSGFVLFHLLKVFRTQLFKITIFKEFPTFPDVLGICAHTLFLGVVVNLFLRIISFFF